MIVVTNCSPVKFAGLKGSDLNRRFFALVTERIVQPICREIRREYGLPDFGRLPPLAEEIELVWGVNSRVFYVGVRPRKKPGPAGPG